MFPSSDSVTWRLLPSPGSGRKPFPCFSGTMRRSDFLPPFPPHSVAFARRYHVVRLVLRSGRPQTHSPPAWSSSIRSPVRIERVEMVGRPRFLKNPYVPVPCSPTPAGPTRQALRRSRHGPRYVHNEGSHENPPFGAQSHGLGTRCLRFAAWVSPGPRKTRFPLVAPLRDGIGYPQDSNERFPRYFLTSLPPSSGLPGARTFRNRINLRHFFFVS